jgi:hypothetical protein
VALTVLVVVVLTSCSRHGSPSASPKPHKKHVTVTTTTTTVAPPTTTTAPPTLAVGTASFDVSASSGSAWRQVLSEVQPSGELSLSASLAAFALAIGPVPGADVTAGTQGPIATGSVAVDSVLAHWGLLTAAQRSAVLTDLQGVPQGQGVSQLCPSASVPAAAPYVALTAGLQQQMTTDTGAAFTGPVFVELDSPVSSGGQAYAYSYPCNSDSGSGNVAIATPATVGRSGVLVHGVNAAVTSCVITLRPSLAPASATTSSILAHELTQCLLEQHLGALYGTMPLWYVEGGATWAEGALTGSGPVPDAWWDLYLQSPDVPTARRTYGGVGFFVHLNETVKNAWQSLLPIGRTFLESGNNNSAAWYAAGVSPTFLNSWGSGFAQGTYSSSSPWTSFGSGFPADSGATAVSLATNTDLTDGGAPVRVQSVGGATQVQRVTVVGSPSGPYVAHVTKSPYANGRISLGFGGQDVTLAAAVGVNFCVAPDGGCSCPTDSVHSNATFTPLQTGRELMAVSGGLAVGVVALTPESLSTFCKVKPVVPKKTTTTTTKPPPTTTTRPAPTTTTSTKPATTTTATTKPASTTTTTATTMPGAAPTPP